MKIVNVDFSDLKPFMSKAKKERVSFHRTDFSNYYGIYENGNLISFYCLEIKNGQARFKSNYTVPEYRKKGCLNAFIKHSIDICKENNVKVMSAFCTPLSLNSHLKNGAIVQSEKNGITFVKYIFCQ